MEALRGHQASLFGAVGAAPNDTRIPSGLLEREILLKLRFSFDHAVNFRPSVLYPGATSPLANPGDIDFVVFREGTEGLYVGNGGSMRTGTNQEIANETSDRKSTRLNSSHVASSYAVYCLKKKTIKKKTKQP